METKPTEPPDGDALKKAFGTALTAAIGDDKGAQTRFAERAGVAQAVISDACAGTKWPRADTLARIAHALGYLNAQAMLVRLLAPPDIQKAVDTAAWLESLSPEQRTAFETLSGTKLPLVSRPPIVPASNARDAGTSRGRQGT